MDTDVDVVDQLERLLSAERVAILSLDGEAVDALAITKERLFGELRGVGISNGDKARMRRIVDAARRNLLLLAHARELTRSAIESITSAERRGLRVSVTG